MQLLKHYRRKDISHPGQQSLIRGTLARTLLVPTVLCLFVLLLDLATPRGVAMGIAYIPLILCGLWYTRPHITFVFAAIATSLTIVAVFVKAPSDVAMWMVLLNRFMTICVLWFVAALIYSHRKYEQILKQSEKPFKSLADALPHIVWTATPDGDLDYYNQLWFDYTGMTFEQTKGWGWKPVLHPDDLQNCIDVWTNAIKNGEFFENEYRFKRVSDGTYRWHLGRGTPVRDANGIIVKWFGTCTDIQDQKRSLHDLKESVEQFQLLANSLLQLVWMADETGWIYWYNDRWYEYTGTVAKDMEGWGWQSVHDQEKLPSVMEKWQKSIATSEPFEMVFPLKGTDGVFRQFLTRVTPVKDGTGKTTKWLGTNTDITDQKGAENKALEALRLSEARYDLTVQGMSIGVWDWNVATGELYWSKRFQDMLGINDQRAFSP